MNPCKICRVPSATTTLSMVLTPTQERRLVALLAQCTFRQAKRLLLRAHLELNGGNKAHAAKSLGVVERTIYNWLKEDEDGQA